MSVDPLQNILLLLERTPFERVTSCSGNVHALQSLQHKVISGMKEAIKVKYKEPEILADDDGVLEILQMLVNNIDTEVKLTGRENTQNSPFHEIIELISLEIIEELKQIDESNSGINIKSESMDCFISDCYEETANEEQDNDFEFGAIEYDPTWDEGDSDYKPELELKNNNRVSRKQTRKSTSKHRTFMCKCDVCEGRFSDVHTENEFNQPTKTFVCENCDVEFSNKTSLKKHSKIHNGENSLLKENLKQLKNIKTKKPCKNNSIKKSKRPAFMPRKYACHLCSAAYKEKQHLDVHILVHKGIKPHECVVCGIRFTQRGHLTIHMRLHTGERPFKCSECKKQFVRNTHLIGHFRRIHLKIPEKYPYKF